HAVAREEEVQRRAQTKICESHRWSGGGDQSCTARSRSLVRREERQLELRRDRLGRVLARREGRRAMQPRATRRAPKSARRWRVGSRRGGSAGGETEAIS